MSGFVNGQPLQQQLIRMGKLLSQLRGVAWVLALVLQSLLGRATGRILGTTAGCEVTTVSSAAQLQQAITARACLIKIVADLDLTTINNESVLFPVDPPDTAIWGDCSGADAVTYGRPHTQAPSTAPGPPRCKLLTGHDVTFRGATGRLWLSNLILQPAEPDLPTAALAELTDGELWMVDVDAVNYGSNIVSVSRSPAYMIDCMFSGPNSSEPLLSFLEASGNTYYLSGVDLPTDHDIRFGPVYVGQASAAPPPELDTDTASTWGQDFTSEPTIVVVDDQSLFSGLTPDTCSRLCIGYRGQGPRPNVYVTRIQPSHSDSPVELRLSDGQLEPAAPVSDISWGGDVKPKDDYIDAWLLLMSKVDVAGIDKALQPTGINSVTSLGTPMLRPYGTMHATNVFKIVFLSLSITVVLIMLVVAPVCYAYRRVKEDKAEMLELQIQTPDDLEMPEEGEEEADTEDEDVCPDVRPPRRLRNWRSRSRTRSVASSSGSLPDIEAPAPAAAAAPNERAAPLEAFKRDFHIDAGNTVEVANLFWGANSTIHRPAMS